MFINCSHYFRGFLNCISLNLERSSLVVRLVPPLHWGAGGASHLPVEELVPLGLLATVAPSEADLDALEGDHHQVECTGNVKGNG